MLRKPTEGTTSFPVFGISFALELKVETGRVGGGDHLYVRRDIGTCTGKEVKL